MAGRVLILLKRLPGVLPKRSGKCPNSVCQSRFLPHAIFSRNLSTTRYLRDEASASEMYKVDLDQYSTLVRRGCNLTAEHVQQRVKIAGWLHFKRLGGQFLVLRDASGIVQVVVLDPLMLLSLKDLSLESVLEVVGVVRERPPGQTNEDMESGAIEIVAEDLKILNKCTANLPFQIRDISKVKESLRQEYRCLSLRDPESQHHLKLGSEVRFRMLEYLIAKNDFVDVATPSLVRKTPGGAREFIVPTHDRGKAYSLAQSPQQFKQLLMVGGIEKYVQFARCFRDETARPDRQPEFTQLDLEMSFVNQEDIKRVMEGLIKHSWPSDLKPIRTPFPRMDFSDAIRVYGSDKPDTRFDELLQEVTDVFQYCEFAPFAKAFRNRPNESVQAVKFSKATPHLSNKQIEKLTKELKNAFQGNETFFVIIRTKEDGSWHGGFQNVIGQPTLKRLQDRLKLEPWDVFILCSGFNRNSCLTAGKFRTEMASLLQQEGIRVFDEDSLEFLWVENFPLFLPKEDESGGLESTHHPFTAPHPDDVKLIYSNPEKVRGQHYDLVLNGTEVAGGSVRIHDAQLQRHVLHNVLKEDPAPLQHLLDALDFGAPPHGGIAMGFERYLSILCKTKSIRDVIAFPKSSEGRCLMTKAPSDVTQEDLKYYHMNFQK